MKIYLFLPFFFKLSLLSAVSISQLSDYPDFCRRAANTEEIFASFKRSAQYQPILEHVSYDQGLEYLQIIKDKYSYVFDHLDACRENDLLGNPITTDFGSPVGAFSPTTLRYMKVAGELIELFGDLKDKNIIEIGAGYGGQCKILSALSGFSSYTIVDLPEASLLAAKYLHMLNVDLVDVQSKETFISSDHYDLVISNYAFSEISKDEQEGYINSILNKSSCGYMTCNFVSDVFGIESLSLESMLELLKIPGRDIQILQEEPSTDSVNLIIVWRQI